jgi:hypothetical protein
MSDIEIPGFEVPDAIVRTRANGVAWRERELPPLREIELLFHELDEVDPKTGRSPTRWRVACKLTLTGERR